MNPELIDKIATLAKQNPSLYQQRSGDDKNLDQFYDLFPMDTLPELTLKQYCMGYGCQPDNFSWWLERGLQQAIGRYSPGNAKGHLIYMQKGGAYYMHRYFSDLGPEDGLQVVVKTIHAIASCSTLEEAKVINDANALSKRAGIARSHFVSGEARRLRILTMYHPDWMLPINSIDHLKHFLTQFSDEDEPELPKKSIDLVIGLSKQLEEIREVAGFRISPWGFSNLLYNEELGIVPPKRGPFQTSGTTGEELPDDETDVKLPLNQILYGPPGTGKTYSTVDRALEIMDPVFHQSTIGEKDARGKRKARFDELMQAKRIGFVTFHQSFSYEDFVEGLKATTDDNGQIRYEIEDGIFKQMCSAASAVSSSNRKAGSSERINPKERQLWKMSLGNTQGPDAMVYDECIENNYVLLGYGWDVDFSGVSNRKGVIEKLHERYPEDNLEYAVSACNAFVNTMKPGDLIIVSDGNHKFRAIGEVTGEYRFLSLEEDREVMYQQCRNVDWIRTFTPSLPYDHLMNKVFSQATIYRPSKNAVDYGLLEALINEKATPEEESAMPFVLIVDEINRGNISRVFGELITLIEDSKRAGMPEAITVKLPYSKEAFSVPSNLHLIGTMNTADRSLAQVDIALRRRFVFEELMPNPVVLSKLPPIEGIHVDKLLIAMNQRIEILYDREHTIGHTFFLSLRNDPSLAEMERIFSGSILPLLEEYFFEDWEKIRMVLADHLKPKSNAIIKQKYSERSIETLLGGNNEHPSKAAYERNDNALGMPESYIGIYDSSIFANSAFTSSNE